MRHVRSLREGIKANAQTIEALDINFVCWENIRRSYQYDDVPQLPLPESLEPCTWDVFFLLFDKNEIVLPRLQSLSFSDAGLGRTDLLEFSTDDGEPPFELEDRWHEIQNLREVELPVPLNISTLRSLRLVNCSDTLRFLRRIVRSGQPLQLKSLELSPHLEDDIMEWQTVQGNHNGETFGVEDFLAAFSGLQNLALRLRGEAKWSKIMSAIMGHTQTLERLVVHHERDCYGVSEVDSDLEEAFRAALWSGTFQQLCRKSDLRLIGVSEHGMDAAVRVSYAFGTDLIMMADQALGTRVPIPSVFVPPYQNHSRMLH